MTRPTDLVEVVLKHGNITVEARRIARAFADSTGRAMAKQYEGHLEVQYTVNEVAAPTQIRPRKRSFTKVPHHFQIVT